MIVSKMWDDEEFLELSTEGKLLWCFFLTGPLGPTGCPGLVKAGPSSLSESLRWNLEEVTRALEELRQRGMIEYDVSKLLLRIPNQPRYIFPRSNKVLLGWFRKWEKLPKSPLKYNHIQSMLSAWEPKRYSWFLRTWQATFGTIEASSDYRQVPLFVMTQEQESPSVGQANDLLNIDIKSDLSKTSRPVDESRFSSGGEDLTGTDNNIDINTDNNIDINPDLSFIKGGVGNTGKSDGSSVLEASSESEAHSQLSAEAECRTTSEGDSEDAVRPRMLDPIERGMRAGELWRLQEELRCELAPDARPRMEPTPHDLRPIREALEIYTMEELENSLRVDAACASQDPAKLEYFNGYSNWHVKHLRRSVGQVMPTSTGYHRVTGRKKFKGGSALGKTFDDDGETDVQP